MNCKPGSFLQYPRVYYRVDFTQLLQHHSLCQCRNPTITTTLRKRHNGVGHVATYKRSLLIATDCERNNASRSGVDRGGNRVVVVRCHIWGRESWVMSLLCTRSRTKNIAKRVQCRYHSILGQCPQDVR